MHALILLLLNTLCFAQPLVDNRGFLPARWHNSGFPQGDDHYNALNFASDGKLYYVISSHLIDSGARMFSFDPATSATRFIGDLTEAAGEKGRKAVPQGKSHVAFFEHKGKLYFATHIGYYRHEGAKEIVGDPPPGYQPYPGGHFMAYDLKTGTFEKLATAPDREGIITMAMDARRGKLYALTWPTGLFLTYDLATRKLENHGPTAGKGERGTGSEFRVVSRSIAVDPNIGHATFSTADGDLFFYDPLTNKLNKAEGTTLRRDAFGQWDPNTPGSMAYNWRQTVFYRPGNVFYGIHGATSMLFRYNSSGKEMYVEERIASQKSREMGMYDSFRYGYLGFTLGPDGHTLYYLTGTPAGEEIRFVTYHIPTRRYIDHGAVVLEDGRRPTWAQAIAVGPDKRIYTVSKIMDNGTLKTDLVSFPDPLQNPPPKEEEYKLIRSWIDPQGMPHPLQEAHGLCLDNQGNVIVVDSIGSRVHRFTPEGKWLAEIGLGPGSGPGQFAGPRDARVHKDGHIYVSDANNARIQVFTHDGKFERMWGGRGSGKGQLVRAHGLEFSNDHSKLFVVDVDNNRVSVFQPLTGELLYDFGRKGERTGEFHEAHGLGILPNGDLIVSSYWGPVQRFTAEGKFLFEFAPAGFRDWIHFHSMTTDREGNIYLAARDRQRGNAIVKYDSRGAYLTTWRMDGVKTAAVDANGLVYTAYESKGKHGVQVYQKVR
ncbi:MAG: NHL repeat-containing protein [Bryobacterales bacterium]|nr:NHL repeat-containing protein [Bryobacterales bacterium]